MQIKLTRTDESDFAFTLEISRVELSRAYHSFTNADMHIHRKYMQSSSTHDVLLGLSMVCRQIAEDYKSDIAWLEETEHEAAEKAQNKAINDQLRPEES